MNKEKIYKIISITIIVILILLNLKNCKTNKDITKKYTNTINALNDTMISYITKDGLQVSKINLIETENIKQFLTIQSNDNQILKLQEEVKKNKKRINKSGSVLIISNKTEVQSSDTTYITSKDTIIRNDTVFIYPEYSSLIKKGLRKDSLYWITAIIKANKDSTSIGISLNNSYTVVIGNEKEKGFKNLFKPKIPFVEVTNENPFTETKTLRAYQIKYPKPKRLGIGFNVGYGLIFDKKPIFSPYIGIGLQYNIIQIL